MIKKISNAIRNFGKKHKRLLRFYSVFDIVCGIFILCFVIWMVFIQKIT